MSHSELDELHQLTASLQRCAASLASKYANSPAARRIVNDAQLVQNAIDRLDIDIDELEHYTGAVRKTQAPEKIAIPETQYDFWRDSGD